MRRHGLPRIRLGWAVLHAFKSFAKLLVSLDGLNINSDQVNSARFVILLTRSAVGCSRLLNLLRSNQQIINVEAAVDDSLFGTVSLGLLLLSGSGPRLRPLKIVRVFDQLSLNIEEMLIINIIKINSVLDRAVLRVHHHIRVDCAVLV